MLSTTSSSNWRKGRSRENVSCTSSSTHVFRYHAAQMLTYLIGKTTCTLNTMHERMGAYVFKLTFRSAVDTELIQPPGGKVLDIRLDRVCNADHR